jgi:hypothetical protein
MLLRLVAKRLKLLPLCRGNVNCIFIFLMDDLKGAAFLNFKAESKLTREGVFVGNCSIIDMTASQEVETVHSDVRNAKGCDTII